MQAQTDKQALVTRLAVCLVVALILYYGGEKVCAALKLPAWESLHPWLEKNRIQALAIATAALVGASLALFPLDQGHGEGDGAPEGYEPCQGGEI